MKRSLGTRRALGVGLLVGVAGAASMSMLSILGGCATDPPKKIVNRYPTLPKKAVPEYLHDTIFEYTDLAATDYLPISSYGLVANLSGTGGSRATTAVRDFMIKEINRHNFGGMDAEAMLANRSFAIVRVDGYIPPGARAASTWSTWIDVRVSALPESDTTSLLGGDLYQTDMKVDGANPMAPSSETVSVKAQAEGPIFINPSYVLDSSQKSVEAKFDRRNAIVLGGARIIEDRPLILRLRTPERRMARALERRINEQFQAVVDDDLQGKGVAAAQDEGVVYVYVPKAYTDDWEHFAQLVKFLYMNGFSPGYAAVQANVLAKQALLPNAPLLEISFCWEGLGKPALPIIDPLMSSKDPNIQYAAARAAAYIGDPAAVPVLVSIARTQYNPFRLNAVKVLGQIPASPMVDKLLRDLLNCDQALVRIEAYKVLARHKDPMIYTRIIKKGEREKFILDIVPGNGMPMVFASRQGLPRLAIFGTQTSLDMPLTYSAFQDKLTISSNPSESSVSLFYRGLDAAKPVKVLSSPDLAEVAARLGGEGPPGNIGLDFGYTEVVAIVQSLINSKMVYGYNGDQRQAAAFVLQDLGRTQAAITAAPVLRDGGRPQSDHSSKGGTAPGQQPALIYKPATVGQQATPVPQAPAVTPTAAPAQASPVGATDAGAQVGADVPTASASGGRPAK